MSSHIRQLVIDSDRVPWGEQCASMLGEAITLADAAGERQWAYAARMRLAQNALMTGDQELLLSTFAICEQCHHDDPVTFPADPAVMGAAGEGYGYADLYWLWKSIPGILECSLAFTRSAIEQVLSTMEASYDRAGLGKRGVHQQLLSLAIMRHDRAGMAKQQAILAELPEDQYSDCPACSTAQMIDCSLLTGDHTTTLELLDQMIAEGQRCAEEPATILSKCLDLFATPQNHHRLGPAIEQISTNPMIRETSPEAIARLAVFLTRCGHHRRGLALLRQVLGLAERNPTNNYAQEILCAALARVCSGARLEMGGELLPETANPVLSVLLSSPPSGHTVETVIVRAATAARQLAKRFDERNGGEAHRKRIEELLDERTIEVELDLPVDPSTAFAEDAASSATLFRLDDAPVAEPPDAAAAISAIAALLKLGRGSRALGLASSWLSRVTDPREKLAIRYLLARAQAATGNRREATCVMQEVIGSFQTFGYNTLAEAAAPIRHLLCGKAPDQQPKIMWADVCDLGRSHGPVVAGFILMHDEWVVPVSEHRLAFEWLTAAINELPLTVWRETALNSRMTLTIRAINASLPLTGMVLESIPPDLDSCHTRSTYETMLSLLSSLAQDHHAAYAHALAALQAASLWASAPFRAVMASRLAKTAVAAGHDSEVLATVNHLVALREQMDPTGRTRVTIECITHLLDVGYTRRAHILAIDLAKEADGAEEIHPAIVAAVHKALAETLIADRHALKAASAELLIAAEFYEKGGEYLYALHSGADAAELRLQVGDVITAGKLADRVIEEGPRFGASWHLLFTARKTLAEAAARTTGSLQPQQVAAAMSDAVLFCSAAPDWMTARASHAEILLIWMRWQRRQGNHREAARLAEEGVQVCPDPDGRTGRTLRFHLARLLLHIDRTVHASRIRSILTDLAELPATDEDMRADCLSLLDQLSKAK